MRILHNSFKLDRIRNTLIDTYLIWVRNLLLTQFWFSKKENEIVLKVWTKSS